MKATRFAHDVEDFCEWYLKKPGRRQAAEVRDYVEYLKDRARVAARR
jgi:hypothetical protein